MITLGLDPGLCRTGWGIIENDDTWRAHGTIQTNDKDPIEIRLAFLYEKINAIFCEYKPYEISIEKIFLNTNPQSTLKLGMARGISIMLAGCHKLKLFEYSPNEIKKAVVGTGHADKNQMMKMIDLILKPKLCLEKDSADALAVALCHVHSRKLQYLIKKIG